MAQAQQVKYTLPSGEFGVVDNATAGNYFGTGSTVGSLTAGAPGYDTTAGNTMSGTAGALSQDKNVFGNGTVLVDPANDQLVFDASNATNQTNYKTVTTVTVSDVATDQIYWKNPA